MIVDVDVDVHDHDHDHVYGNILLHHRLVGLRRSLAGLAATLWLLRIRARQAASACPRSSSGGPSCAQRRALDFGDWVVNEVIQGIPIVSCTFTIPKSDGQTRLIVQTGTSATGHCVVRGDCQAARPLRRPAVYRPCVAFGGSPLRKRGGAVWSASEPSDSLRSGRGCDAGTGIGVVTAVVLGEAVSPLLGIPVGIGIAGAAIYTAIGAWHEAGVLNRQAAELHEKTGCYTPGELNQIYHSIP